MRQRITPRLYSKVIPIVLFILTRRLRDRSIRRKSGVKRSKIGSVCDFYFREARCATGIHWQKLGTSLLGRRAPHEVTGLVIDFHAHYPRQEGFLPALLEALPRVGIDRICLCSAGENFGHVSNREVREAFERHPNRIIGLALVRLGIDPPGLIDECVRQGFRGIKTTNPTAPYDDPSFFRYYERIEHHGLPILFHTGIVMRTPADRELQVSSSKMQPIRLDAVARSFPGMNIVAAHLGVPWYEEASMLARMHPNFYVDLTGAWWGGWRANKGPDFYRYHFFWPEAWSKVVFGTDILHVEELEPSKLFHDRMLEPLELGEEVLAKIYGGTAARLLKIEG